MGLGEWERNPRLKAIRRAPWGGERGRQGGKNECTGVGEENGKGHGGRRGSRPKAIRRAP